MSLISPILCTPNIELQKTILMLVKLFMTKTFFPDEGWWCCSHQCWGWCWLAAGNGAGCVGRMVYRWAGVWWECMHEGGYMGVNMGKCAGRDGVWAGSYAWWNSTMRYMLEFRLLVTSLPTHVFLVTFNSVPMVHVSLLANICLRFFSPLMHLSLHSTLRLRWASLS